MKKNIFTLAFALSIITPAVSFAALKGIKDLLTTAKDLINMVIPIVFGIALIFFFWGVAQFILHSGKQEELEQGKQKMLWGIIALFVIVSIYGILAFMSSATGIAPGGSLTPGSVNSGSNGNGSGSYDTGLMN